MAPNKTTFSLKQKRILFVLLMVEILSMFQIYFAHYLMEHGLIIHRSAISLAQRSLDLCSGRSFFSARLMEVLL